MGTFTVTYTPSVKSVERKNDKFSLAFCILDIWEIVNTAKDFEEMKKLITNRLLRVL